jgi:hypothetical protein
MTDSRWVDPEIDTLFVGEPELEALAHRVRASRPEPPLDPRFSAVLRAQLMREAQSRPPVTAKAPRRRSAGRRWLTLPSSLAWSGAGVGVALVAAAAVFTLNTHVQDHSVTAISPVAELHAVSPDNVITVAFSQPMNETAVVAGLHIRPATQVTTAWHGNNLLISPTHHLAGNTPYTVTIDHAAAKAASGELAPAAITISFGTAPTPPAQPTVAILSPVQLGPVDPAAQLLAGPGETVIATSAVASASGASTQVAPSSTPSTSASPAAAQAVSLTPPASGTPASSPIGTAAGGSAVVDFAPGGPATVLGPAAGSAAVSPNGRQLLTAAPTTGGVQIRLTSLNGTTHTVLTTIGAPVLAAGWRDAATALIAEPDRVVAVDLQGHVSTIASLPAGTTSVVLAPGGATAFAGADAQDGQLVDVAGGQAHALPGSRNTVAFSGDGGTVAWVDSTGATPKLMTAPVAGGAAATVPTSHPGAAVSDVALDHAGTRIAFLAHTGAGAGELDVESLPAGTLVGRGPAASRAVFLTNGDLGVVTAGGQAAEVAVPGTNQGGTSPNALPDGATQALQAFVDAQTAGDRSALRSLSVSTIDAVHATPRGLTRSYVISAVANSDGSVSATARLIVDPSADHPLASFADEILVLAKVAGGSPFQVTSLTVGALTDEPVGPHVLHVVSAASSSKLALQVSFDSDLAASTVAAAMQVTTRGGQVLHTSTVYNANTRTATVLVDVPPDTAVVLNVGTGLLDVDGQALAQIFSTVTGG